LGKKPAVEQDCDGEAPECKDCKAVVFGGPEFDGWSLEFMPGEYTVSDMEARGAKCDDISSVKVFGVFCETDVFQYGDFNQAHKGWSVTLKPGSYNRKQLVDHGAQDNDISSMKVRRTLSPHLNGSYVPHIKSDGLAGVPAMPEVHGVPTGFPRPENLTKGWPSNITKMPFGWNPFSSAPTSKGFLVAAVVAVFSLFA
jgi:hypothetical protein